MDLNLGYMVDWFPLQEVYPSLMIYPKTVRHTDAFVHLFYALIRSYQFSIASVHALLFA